MARTRVLIVDDSALMREALRDIISRDAALEVVGVAADPLSAWARIKVSHPDVITMDVEMPRMDGITFMERLMAVRPIPIVMVSALTESGCATAVRAFELGAVDFVTKPAGAGVQGIEQVADEIVAKIKIAAGSRRRRRFRHGSASRSPSSALASGPPAGTREAVIAIGASTGGPEVLIELLPAMPVDAPGIVVVQHMGEGFTATFARRLDDVCRINVSEARDGDAVLPGRALIAPGNLHTRVYTSGGRPRVRVFEGEPVSRHRPSADVLFESCAAVLGDRAVGLILSGMGVDGARGLLAMKREGSVTIAQDEESCVVFGMPREAIGLGAATHVLAPEHIPGAVLAGCARVGPQQVGSA